MITWALMWAAVHGVEIPGSYALLGMMVDIIIVGIIACGIAAIFEKGSE